jgi:hypothetical protein
MWHSSRRGFFGYILASLFHPRLNGQSASAPSANSLPSRSTYRTYRADAVILFLGIPIYRRAGVGGGRASVEETGEGASLRRTFFFAGGSDPKQALGLKRLGWIQEVVIGPSSEPLEAEYFGVLTSSPEESLEHARKSVAASPSGGASILSAVNGRHTPGHSRSAVTHFEYAANALWSDRGLVEKARSTFDANVNWRETTWPKQAAETPPTFLFQLANLLQQRTRRAEGRYVYNEQEYHLELDIPLTGRERAVRGTIHNLHTGHTVTFRLWLQDAGDSIVPIRIEFQPRSFLRLTFEALPA